MKKIFLLLSFVTVIYTGTAQQTVDCNVATSQSYLNINNIKAYLSNSGEFFTQRSHGYPRPGYIVETTATGFDLNTIFTSAIWLGAVDEASGALKVAANTYRQSGNDFWPGPINDETKSTDFEQCNNYDKHWKVNKTNIDKFKAGAQLTDDQKKEIYKWPAKSNPHIYFNHLNQVMAPFVDVDGDDIYNPDNGDYPKIKGDQAIWWLINDVGNTHTESAGAALGFEVKKMAYAYVDEQRLKNSTFLEVTITNKSNNNYKDFLLGHWIDFDLGNFNDDFIGCDTLNAIGYAYNGDDFDESAKGFGYNAPLQGCQFLDVPPNYYNTKNKMYAFVYYINHFNDIGTPGNVQQYHTYLQGIWKNGLPITYGGNGTAGRKVTPYMYSGNPSDPNGWSECSVPNEPADRRMVMSSGKYKFAAGETKTWTMAMHTIPNVGGTCPNIQPLIDKAKYAKTFFERFVLVDVDADFSVETIATYPNPTNNKLYFKSPTSINKVKIFGIDGKMILQKKINTNYVNVVALSKGLYYANLFGEDGKVYRTKFVKE